MNKSDELKAMSKNELVREVLNLRGLLSQQMAAAPGTGDEVIVEGVVSVRSGEPFVFCRAGEAVWQWTPAQAREHALFTLDAAVEAERDAATVDFLTAEEHMGMDDQAAAGFLDLLRSHRKPWVLERQAGDHG